MTHGLWTQEGLRRAIDEMAGSRRVCTLARGASETIGLASALAQGAVRADRPVTLVGSPAFIEAVTATAGEVRPEVVVVPAPWPDPARAAEALIAAGSTAGPGGHLILLDAAGCLGAGADPTRTLVAQRSIEDALGQIGATVVTLYDESAFEPAALVDAVLCTPGVFMWDVLCENVRYVPPDTLLTDEREALMVDRLLRTLYDSEQNRRSAREREQGYRALVENSPDSVFVHSGGAIVYANQAAATMVGAATPAEVLGVSVMRFVHPDSIESVGGRIRMMLEDKITAPLMFERFVRLDGTPFYAEAVASPLTFEGHPAIQVLMRDQTDRHATEEELQFKSFLLDSVVDGIAVRDPNDMCVLYVNEAMCSLTGQSREQFFASHDIDWASPEDREAVKRHFESVLRLGTGSMEATAETSDGQRVPVEMRTSAVTYLGRRVLVSVLRDITERKAAQATIEHMALHDPLTGLANRALLHDRLEVAIAHARRAKEPLGLIYLDVDHFKTVNDTAGHGTGDRLLQGIAERLHMAVRADDTVARLGGDEFSLVLPDIGTEDDACRLADKILERMREPIDVGNESVTATVSIGIAIHDGGEATADEFLRHADLAMYVAKEAGRNGYRLYEPSMNVSALERYVLRGELQRAVERGEMELHFQPIVRLSDGKVLGAEALCRWNHAVHGQIPPATFIPLAEENGTICQLGDWVLRTACVEAKRWADEGHEGLRVSVNLSPRQLYDMDLATAVRAVLEETGLRPDLLELEITETVAVRDAPRLMGAFGELRELGVRIAIDDFGTGYSSLDYLKRFPVDTIKVDRTFVKDLCEDASSLAIATAIVSLARALGLEVIAEGVETEDQRTALVDALCPSAQGFLFSKGVPGPEFRTFMGERSSD